MKKTILLIMLWPLTAQSVWAGADVKAVKQGNVLYGNKKYARALEKYNEALDKDADSPLISFNIGAALYQKGEYAKAVEVFIKALIAEDVEIEAGANYNIGNAKYRQGELKEGADLARAVEIYKEVLDYYKRAMELDENLEEAKFNYEFVERKLKVLLDELKKQQQESQKDSQEDGEEENQEGSSQGDMEEKETDAGGQAEEGAAEQSERESVEEDDDAIDEEVGQETKGDAEDSEELTEEQARMLLEGYAQEELESVKKLKDKQRVFYSPAVGKDW